jgi:hypothetical protein
VKAHVWIVEIKYSDGWWPCEIIYHWTKREAIETMRAHKESGRKHKYRVSKYERVER